MKTLFTFVFTLLLYSPSEAQDKTIETESVKLDNFISFIVDQYDTKRDSTSSKNITFLIETYADRFNSEDRIILNQGFKLLSKRLTEKDQINIVMHSHLNGIALDNVKASNIKSLLHVIENPKSHIQTSKADGVDLAYEFTEDTFKPNSENSVVMLRIPNRKPSNSVTSELNVQTTVPEKNNAVVLTAIALLPEIIALIKQ